jgi:hypothetical protein
MPISCISIDKDDRHLNFNMGVLYDLSQGGAAVEVVSEVVSERVVLSFVNLDMKIHEINGVVIHKRPSIKGKTILGIMFQGSSNKVLDFISNLVRFHNQTKRKDFRQANAGDDL